MTRNELIVLSLLIVAGVSAMPMAMATDGIGGDEQDSGGCEKQQDFAGWEHYGFAVPGASDSNYGFGLPDPMTKDLVVMIAKGNVTVGDYTSANYKSTVLSGAWRDATLVHAYSVDPSDISLGYCTSDPCDASHPLFDGNYNQSDMDGAAKGLKKWDRNGHEVARPKQRSFYESSLADSEFKALIDPSDPLYNVTGNARLDGVYFTNHAFSGFVPANTLSTLGSIVARDEAFIFGYSERLNHDIRLLQTLPPGVVLPFSITRPTLQSWKECPPTGSCA